MPATQVREVAAAQRLENVRYAIRDLACVADEVANNHAEERSSARADRRTRFDEVVLGLRTPLNLTT